MKIPRHKNQDRYNEIAKKDASEMGRANSGNVGNHAFMMQRFDDWCGLPHVRAEMLSEETERVWCEAWSTAAADANDELLKR